MPTTRMMTNASSPRAVPSHPAFLDGGGECGERLRSYDWAGSRMGPPELWPLCLQTVLRTCLLYTSPSPRDRQKSRMPSSA